MLEACFLGRGKVHGSLAAVGTTVDNNPFWIVVACENMMSKVYTNHRGEAGISLNQIKLKAYEIVETKSSLVIQRAFGIDHFFALG